MKQKQVGKVREGRCSWRPAGRKSSPAPWRGVPPRASQWRFVLLKGNRGGGGEACQLLPGICGKFSVGCKCLAALIKSFRTAS